MQEKVVKNSGRVGGVAVAGISCEIATFIIAVIINPRD